MFYSESHVFSVCRPLQLHPCEGDPPPDSGSKNSTVLPSLHISVLLPRDVHGSHTHVCINVCLLHSLTVLKQKCASHTFLPRHCSLCAFSFQTHGSVRAAPTELSGTLPWGETWHGYVVFHFSLTHEYFCFLIPLWGHTHAASQTKSISMVQGDLRLFFPKSGRGKLTKVSEGYANIAKCLRANGTWARAGDDVWTKEWTCPGSPYFT